MERKKKLSLILTCSICPWLLRFPRKIFLNKTNSFNFKCIYHFYFSVESFPNLFSHVNKIVSYPIIIVIISIIAITINDDISFFSRISYECNLFRNNVAIYFNLSSCHVTSRHVTSGLRWDDVFFSRHAYVEE